MLLTRVVMYSFREFTGTGVRNGVQIETPQRRKETHARTEVRGGCPRSLLCKQIKRGIKGNHFTKGVRVC